MAARADLQARRDGAWTVAALAPMLLLPSLWALHRLP